jgi:hypothetical protein
MDFIEGVGPGMAGLASSIAGLLAWLADLVFDKSRANTLVTALACLHR